MGTSAFDKLWGDAPTVKAADPFDALWDGGTHKPLTKPQLDRLAKNNAEKTDAEKVGWRDYLDNVTQTVGTVGAGIPGFKLAVSAGRAKLQGRPMADVQKEVNAETSDVPYASAAGRMLGTMATAPFLPAGGAASGAILGGADQLLNNDVNSGIKERLWRGVGGAAVGGAAGGLIDGAMTAVRSKIPEVSLDALKKLGAPKSLPDKIGTQTLGANALARKNAMQAADAINYGNAAQEGVTAGTALGPATRASFHNPDVQPYVDAVKGSSLFKNADDATILREAYKLMSERQGNLGRTIANASDFKAGSSLEKREIDAGKQALMGDADPMMPSFRGAVDAHRVAAQNLDAMGEGADAAKLLMGYRQIPGEKLNVESPEAFMASLVKMTPDQKKAALEGALGRVKDNIKLSPNVFTGFGTLSSALKASRTSPLVNALDRQTGNVGVEAGRKALLSLILANRPGN